MRNSRKILIGMLAAAGLAAAGSIVYADPPGGFGAGYGPCAFGAGGPGAGGGYGPGMMGYGGGHWGGYGPGMGYGGGPRGGYGPGMMGGGPRSGYGPGMMGGGRAGGYGPGAAAAGTGPAEWAEARISFLKNELKITADQEAAWDAYAKQVKARAETMQAFHAQGPITADTPAERIEQHAARMKLRADQEQALSSAVKDLFAVLTPEQKTVANQYFGGTRVGQAGGRGYGRGRWN